MKIILLNLGRGSVVPAQLCPSAPPATTRSPRSRANLWLMRISLAYSILIASSIQLLASTTNGQTIDKELVTIELHNDNLVAMVKKIEAQSTLRFIYLPEQLSKYGSVTLAKAKRTVKETLDLVLAVTELNYEQSGKYVVLKDRAAPAATYMPVSVERDAMATLVTGTVKGQDGLTLAGVSIVVKGTTRGTTSDGKGIYVIQVDNNDDILVFSFIGFRTIEVPVGDHTVLDVKLEEDATTLSSVEIVGTNYFSLNKERSTMNVAKVESKDIAHQPITSMLMSLQGRMAGVDVAPYTGAAGSAVKVQIRGNNSMRPDGSYPLYVIDGVPIDSSPIKSGSASLFLYGFDPLSTLDPNNIESIEVLKDGAATAIYGSRGANGVVRITTKKSQQTTATSVNVSGYQGVGIVTNRLDVLDTKQYLAVRRQAYKNDGLVPSGTAANDLLVWDTTRYTNWQDKLLGGTANITDVQASLSGGNGNTSFTMGGGYHRETVIFPGDFGFRRITGHLSINHISANKKFTATVSTNYGGNNSKLFNDLNFVTQALMLPPNAPALYGERGELNWEIGPNGASTWVNPLANLRRTHNSNGDNLVANSVLSYEILKGIILKTNLGFNRLSGNENIIDPISAQSPTAISAYSTGISTFGTNDRKSWIIEPQVTVERQFTNHRINGVLGTTLQSSNTFFQLIRGTGYTSDAALGTPEGAGTKGIDSFEKNQYRYTAFFAYLGYSFKSKYLLDLTGRRDGSSRFGPGKQFGNFGSIAAGWIFTNESILSNSSFLSFGKIRGSLGVTGNDQIGDYKYLNTYKITDYQFLGSTSYSPSALYNPDFAWEQTRKLEAGLELGFFKNRLSIEASHYSNRSGNQLIDYQLPASTGFPSVFKNFDAVVKNYGWEFVISTSNIRRNEFTWRTTINISTPRNRLIKFDGIEDSPYSETYKVGEPLSVQRLFKYTGVDPQTGLFTVLDANSDGSFDNHDKFFMTSLDKKYYGGINNTIQYKSFELSFLFQFSKQNTYKFMPAAPGRPVNQPVEVLNAWKQEGDNTEYQKYSRGSATSAAYTRVKQSDYYIEDGSFLRLKTLSLSYSVPSIVLQSLRITQGSIFVQGQNLLTFTRSHNLDPETGVSLPPLKMLTVGLNIKI